ncbi:hypothetical protein GWO43_09310 [candidate division KSB1 bacterium]|nr:hypothetical protein [candidate division KSB1 bacterium]NIR69346.1 hypothetical protein [candidate division KSB1 bacterium]NIS24164.1 hypothetical protein [candidate division KSB1 bacterium]NIT71079.1 hypothetical protein [candidate division KSB1 bacterium]NIU24783.1 hypothetical protein [candidate division KSB1 bacterium]
MQNQKETVDVRDEIDPKILEKIKQGIELTKEERRLVQKITDLGDTCGCDSDHRIRDLDDEEDPDRKISFTQI